MNWTFFVFVVLSLVQPGVPTLAASGNAKGFSGRIAAWGLLNIPLVDPNAKYKEAFALGGFSAGVSENGEIIQWGFGSVIRPGEGPSVSFPEGIVDPIKMVPGMILRRDGTVIEYGDSIIAPEGLSNIIDIAVSDSGWVKLALKSDGTVVAWGKGPNNRDPSMFVQGLTNIIQVAASSHALALTADGKVLAWAVTPSFPTNVPPEVANVTAIAAGLNQNLALRSDGSVIAWGMNYARTNVPPGLTNAIAIAAGNYHNVALTAERNVVAWGRRSDLAYDQTTVPVEATNIVKISAAGDHTLALRGDGRIIAWGANQYGQSLTPHDFVNVSAISAASSHGLILRSDGTIAGWGTWKTAGRDFTLVLPPGLTNILALATGEAYDVALRSDGTVVQWGHLVLPPASSISNNIVEIGAGDSFGLGLDAAGNVFQLQMTPPPPDLPPLVAVDGGREFSVGLKADGTMAMWKSDGTVINDLPAGFTNITSIAAGPTHVLARRSDGSVVAFGSNDHGQSTVPASVSNVVAIAAADAWSIAAAEDGTISSWGQWGPAGTIYYEPNPPAGRIPGVRMLAAGAQFAVALVTNPDVAPRLQAQLEEQSFVLTWPKSSTGWFLESRVDLSEATFWQAEAAQIDETGLTFEVRLPLNSFSKLYRLRRP